MATPKMVLDYLKAFLSAPVMSATTAIVLALLFREPIKSLFARIASLKVAGLGELQITQSSRAELPAASGNENPESLPAQVTTPSLLPSPSGADLVKAERERAYLWEYRYLNLYLVRGTQLVLDWFASRSGPTTFAVYDSWWSSIVYNPTERLARVEVLRSHYLITESNGLLTVSEKGREYLGWRGQLPPIS